MEHPKPSSAGVAPAAGGPSRERRSPPLKREGHAKNAAARRAATIRVRAQPGPMRHAIVTEGRDASGGSAELGPVQPDLAA